MFTDSLELKDMCQDAEYKDLLGRVLTIQGDCEIGGPHLYVKDILPVKRPRRLTRWFVARTAAEEIDHFRKMARMAGEIGMDVSHAPVDQPVPLRRSLPHDDHNVGEFAVFGFLVDRVGKFQLDEFLGCSYAPSIAP